MPRRTALPRNPVRPALAILAAVLAACGTGPTTTAHPLAPLSAAEIRDAARIIRQRVPETARFSIIALAILAAVLAACGTGPTTTAHPLAPLSAAEIRDAARIIRQRVPETARFSIIALDAPSKEIVLSHI